MARAMPVLPEDGSMIVRPGTRSPSRSAAASMARAMRSFTEPAGFWPSSLARIRTFGLGLSWLTSTMGVSPIRSSTEAWTAMIGASAAGHSRQDGDLVALLERGVELAQEADVLVVDVDV